MKECRFLGCCKRAWKGSDGDSLRWIILRSIVLGRRGDWGWSPVIATLDQASRSFRWLWENQSNHHRLSPRLAYTQYLHLSEVQCTIDLRPNASEMQHIHTHTNKVGLRVMHCRGNRDHTDVSLRMVPPSSLKEKAPKIVGRTWQEYAIWQTVATNKITVLVHPLYIQLATQ